MHDYLSIYCRIIFKSRHTVPPESYSIISGGKQERENLITYMMFLIFFVFKKPVACFG